MSKNNVAAPKTNTNPTITVDNALTGNNKENVMSNPTPVNTVDCEVCEGTGCRICTAACEECKLEGDFLAGLCPECEEKANAHWFCNGTGCPLCRHVDEEAKTSVDNAGAEPYAEFIDKMDGPLWELRAQAEKRSTLSDEVDAACKGSLSDTIDANCKGDWDDNDIPF